MSDTEIEILCPLIVGEGFELTDQTGNISEVIGLGLGANLTLVSYDPVTKRAVIRADGSATAIDGVTVKDLDGSSEFDKITILQTKGMIVKAGVNVGEVTIEPVSVDTTSGLKQNSIPMWDTATMRFVPSGAQANGEGEITIAPNTLNFGQHAMSSAIEDVTFTNTLSGVNYSPIWQELSPGSKDATIREVSNEETIFRVPLGTDDVVNPVNNHVVNENEVFLGGEFSLINPSTNVVLEFYNVKDQLIWRYKMGDLLSGDNSITFGVPFKILKGFNYRVELRSEDGDIVAKGIGTQFSWTIQRATFTEAIIAKKRDVDVITSKVGSIDTDVSTLKRTSQANETAINSHGVQLSKNAAEIADNEKNISDVDGKTSGYEQHLDALLASKIDDISHTVDNAAKTVDINLIANNKTTRTETIDLSGMFGTTPPVVETDIYYWFTAGKNVIEEDILKGIKEKVNRISGERITMTRPTGAQAYMWIWIPDSLGIVRGFTFSGFLSVWTSTTVSVAGVAGKLYVSPNTTAAKTVNYEVTV